MKDIIKGNWNQYTQEYEHTGEKVIRVKAGEALGYNNPRLFSVNPKRIFAGKYKTEDGTILSTDDNSFQNYVPKGNEALTAVFTDAYQITFDANRNGGYYIYWDQEKYEDVRSATRTLYIPAGEALSRYFYRWDYAPQSDGTSIKPDYQYYTDKECTHLVNTRTFIPEGYHSLCGMGRNRSESHISPHLRSKQSVPLIKGYNRYDSDIEGTDKEILIPEVMRFCPVIRMLPVEAGI